jgi:Protein of unknown function (DUF732)
MRCAATFAVPLTGLALILCPVAQADTDNDGVYEYALSSNRVIYQDRVTRDEMLATGHNVCANIRNNPTTAGVVAARDAIVRAGIFSQKEASGIIQSATTGYCPEFSALYYGASLG